MCIVGFGIVNTASHLSAINRMLVSTSMVETRYIAKCNIVFFCNISWYFVICTSNTEYHQTRVIHIYDLKRSHFKIPKSKIWKRAAQLPSLWFGVLFVGSTQRRQASMGYTALRLREYESTLLWIYLNLIYAWAGISNTSRLLSIKYTRNKR